MSYWARSARGKQPAQTYGAHIRGVLSGIEHNLTALLPFIASEKADYYATVVRRAAACHDLGKLSAVNQQVLSGAVKAKKLPVDHRDAGTCYLLSDKQEESAEAILVYAHHAPGLPNLIEQSVSALPFRFDNKAIADTEKNLAKYIRQHEQEAGVIPEDEQQDSVNMSSLGYRVLLSCLVDADYSDAGDQHHEGCPLRWQERLTQLDSYVAGLKAAGKEHVKLNIWREKVYSYCHDAPVDSALEYCDSPVGTGKTTAVMAHMLKAAEQYQLRHIVIILPYTNIITQTAAVLRQAVVLPGEDPEEIVVEHHHQADFEKPELRHLAATWSAPIIVTTAVQFFETLASNLPAKLRKLHQLPGSGIIIDESHAALPLELLPPAWRWLTELTDQWGCKICLCSGTTIKFWETEGFRNLSSQIVTALLPEDMSRQLNDLEKSRIKRNAWEGSVPHFNSVEDFTEAIESFKGAKIVVMNTIASAAYLAHFLRKQGKNVLHLSTALMPKDQARVIEEVQYRLSVGEACFDDWILVATSSVECGLDFSFHYGFCERSSLARYLQLSGRISRNGEYPDGALMTFTIVDDHLRSNPAFVNAESVFAKMIESQRLVAMSITEAVTEAFIAECKMLGELPQHICKKDRLNEFAYVAETFRVIPDETITVVADQILAKKIRAGLKISARELQKGSVAMRKPILQALGLACDELPILREEQYDAFLGYMKTLV